MNNKGLVLPVAIVLLLMSILSMYLDSQHTGIDPLDERLIELRIKNASLFTFHSAEILTEKVCKPYHDKFETVNSLGVDWYRTHKHQYDSAYLKSQNCRSEEQVILKMQMQLDEASLAPISF